MATVRKLEGGRITHIEAEGCLINVREGLEDRHGRRVTHLELCCDDYPGEKPWRVEGRTRKYLGCRVIEVKARRKRKQ